MLTALCQDSSRSFTDFKTPTLSCWVVLMRNSHPNPSHWGVWFQGAVAGEFFHRSIVQSSILTGEPLTATRRGVKSFWFGRRQTRYSYRCPEVGLVDMPDVWAARDRVDELVGKNGVFSLLRGNNCIDFVTDVLSHGGVKDLPTKPRQAHLYLLSMVTTRARFVVTGDFVDLVPAEQDTCLKSSHTRKLVTP